MAINTSAQFNGGIKTLASQGSKTRSLIQELLITAVFFAERDGDVSPINRVVNAVSELKSMDMWKIHKWLKTYEAPVKPSDDGKTYVFDKSKRHLTQGADRDMFAPYETVMRQEPAWYELTKAETTPQSVWDAENSFESFAKRLSSKGFSEAADAVSKLLTTLKKQGKLRTTTEQVLANAEPAPL